MKECFRKYYYTYIEEWQSKRVELPLSWGRLYHLGQETRNREQLNGAEPDAALRTAIRTVLEASGTREGGWKPYEGDKVRNAFSLVRALVWYVEAHKNDPIKTYCFPDGTPAVELAFRLALPLATPDGDSYLYCGVIDDRCTDGSADYVRDYKSTTSNMDDRYFSQFSPDNQMSGYAASANVLFDTSISGVFLDVVQLGVSFCRFNRRPIPRTEEQLQEWQRDTMHWIKLAEVCAETGVWPMNEKSCHHFTRSDGTGGCPFLPACSRSPSIRQEILEADYVKVERNPLRD